MTITTKRRLIALVITLVMAFSMVLPAFADDGDKLDTPVLIAVGEASIASNGGIQNPARHTQFRLLLFEAIEGATGYDVYAFATRADAQAGENAIAVAKNVNSTAPSQSGGGTQGTVAISIEEGQVGIDVRLVQFEDIEEGATRDLPEDYTPAGLGDSYMPGAPGSGNTTNLKPGVYWFSVRAVDSEDPSRDSDFAEPHEDAFSIAIGPDEARDIILSRLDELGDTPEATLRLIDLRAPAEFADEGLIRFFDDRIEHTQFNTVEAAEEIFGHVDDKDAVTIFVVCRGGGRTVSAARHLSDAGYTNVYNMQGVNQWSFGLRYDDPTFRFRIIETGDEGDLDPPRTADNPYVPGIFFDEEAGLLRWANIPRAVFNVYAFETEDETDVANAIAMGSLAAIPLDVSGLTRDHRWVRVFDLALLDLVAGTYYIRVQAAPEVMIPVEGVADTSWGAYSVLSDAIEFTTDGIVKPPHDDINVLLNDFYITFADQPPVMVENRTLVPFRGVFEAMGAEELEWDPDTRTVTAARGGIELILTIDSNIILVNGEEVEIDVPAQIMNDRTLVPIRGIFEAFGAYVDWEPDTRTVIIIDVLIEEE